MKPNALQEWARSPDERERRSLFAELVERFGRVRGGPRLLAFVRSLKTSGGTVGSSAALLLGFVAQNLVDVADG